MNVSIRFVPLDLKDFPGPRGVTRRVRSQFKAGWSNTLNLLDRELWILGARNVVLQAGFRADQLRQDSWPLGRATPSHPAVIVSFNDSDNRPLSFPCDRYDSYEHNLRAIALSLEALRAVDRHGVTKRGEQYAGFKQIEAPKQWTVDDAAQFLGAKTGYPAQMIVEDPDDYRKLYRAAAKTLHPDQGGNPHEWKLLGDAKALLDLHHGLGGSATA